MMTGVALDASTAPKTAAASRWITCLYPLTVVPLIQKKCVEKRMQSMSEAKHYGATVGECIWAIVGFLLLAIVLALLAGECSDLNRRVQALEVTGTAARGPQCTALGKSWKPREDGNCYVADMPK